MKVIFCLYYKSRLVHKQQARSSEAWLMFFLLQDVYKVESVMQNISCSVL